MADAELVAIEERVNAATAGPWDRIEEEYEGTNGQRYCMGPNGIPTAYCYGSNSLADIRFVGHAREDVPALVAEIRRLQGLLKQAHDDLDAVKGT